MVAGALVTVATTVPLVTSASAAPLGPVVRLQSHTTVPTNVPVEVAVYRLDAGHPVTIRWGDGTRSTVRSGCRTSQARRHPTTCSARVKHAYAASGTFVVAVSRPRFHVVVRVVGGQATAPTADRDWQESMLDAVNDLRARAGVAPLKLCGRLTSTANDYANLMARTNHYGHVGPDGTQPWDRITAHGYVWHAAAENIAAGFVDVNTVMAAWQASPGHLENIVNPEFEHVGFGEASVAGTQYGSYWVQNFGAGGSCS